MAQHVPTAHAVRHQTFLVLAFRDMLPESLHPRAVGGYRAALIALVGAFRRVSEEEEALLLVAEDLLAVGVGGGRAGGGGGIGGGCGGGGAA